MSFNFYGVRNGVSIPLWVVFWAALVSVSLLSRTYLPIDETRYVSVAWEMWLRGDFLVPHLNGEVYSHKPPLLFWLFQLGWALFGVGETWPRLVNPLFGAGSLVLTSRLARRLWPASTQAAALSPLILVSSLLWSVFVSAAMFDMLVVFFTLMGILGIVRSWQDADGRGWLLLGGAIGLGILAKGPVILVHTLPAALLAPWWAVRDRPPRWISWYAGVALAVLMGVLIALAWAVPAASAGGEQYSRAIYWGQSAGRIVQSFAHKRPFWWYVPLLPLILLPWTLWPALWRAFGFLAWHSPSSGSRLCLAWFVPALAVLSLISGKQPHYLLPEFPAFALLSAHALDTAGDHRPRDPVPTAVFLAAVGLVLMIHGLIPLGPEASRVASRVNPYYGIALAALGAALFLAYPLAGRIRPALVAGSAVLMVVLMHLSLAELFVLYDMRDLSRYIAGLEKKGISVSYVGKYHGEFNFLGRLEQPLDHLNTEQVRQWAAGHPEGRIVADEEHVPQAPGARPEFERPHGLHIIRVWKAGALATGWQHAPPSSG